MKSNLRLLSSLAALPALAAAAHGAVVLSFGTPSGTPLTALAAPAKGATTTISVFYTSTTILTDSEVFVAFDHASAQGSTAPIDKLVSLSSPSAASGVALNMVQTNGGYGGANLDRPYGLDILSVSAPSGSLPIALTPARLFDVTLTNLSLLSGTATLSFSLANAPIYTTNFYDGNANPVGVAGTSLVVAAASPVPEPAPLAALGLSAMGLLRRRRGWLTKPFLKR